MGLEVDFFVRLVTVVCRTEVCLLPSSDERQACVERHVFQGEAAAKDDWVPNNQHLKLD